MTIRILPAVADPETARALATMLGRLPDAEPGAPVGDSAALLDTLGRLAAAGLGELPEVVLVDEAIGPLPALELVGDIALRFPAVAVVLLGGDTGPARYSAAMDAGARGLLGLPLSYDELASRIRAAAAWAAGVRRHLGGGADPAAGRAGRVVSVSGAKGGVGTTVTAVQLALAARASGASVALADMDLQTGDIASYLDVQFRRSIADLAEINDISPRVLADAMFTHSGGVALLLGPSEGEQGETVTDRAARHIVAALRARFDVVVIDCGSQLNGANAAAVEMADIALLLTTPDVVAVRAAKRTVRLWDRLRVRKPQDIRIVVNRLTRQAEIQPPLVERITGTRVTRAAVPAAFKELQPVVDSGRMDELDGRSTVRQALWALAAELGIAGPSAGNGKGGGAAKGDGTGSETPAAPAPKPPHRLGRRADRRAIEPGARRTPITGGS